MTLRAAIIGFGKIAESTHVPALARRGIDLVAVVDGGSERLAAAEKSAPGARRYSDIASMLSTEAVDIVDICTPPYLHFEQAAAALEAGAHVFCEKPLVLSMEHGHALRALANERGRSIVCVHNWTYAPTVRRLFEIARSGELGRVERITMETIRTMPAAVAGDTANWRIDPEKAGGGIMFDHGWHGMSILLRLARCASETAIARTVTATVEKRRHKDLPVEDTVDVGVSFDTGSSPVGGRFFATWAGNERAGRITLDCTAGRAIVENARLTVTQGDRPACVETFADSLAAGGYRSEWTAGVLAELEEEIAQPQLRGRGLDEALTCLALLRAAYAAGDSGAPVALAVGPGA